MTPYLFLIIFGLTWAEPKIEDNVYVLNKDNFEETISKNKFVLVKFCKYYSFLASIFDNAVVFGNLLI